MLYYMLSFLLIIGILLGILMMSRVQTARGGNLLSSICTALAIILVLYIHNLFTSYSLLMCIIIGLIIGLIAARKVRMIDMPQTVALLNGFGGIASALVSLIIIIEGKDLSVIALYAACISITIGFITFVGSLIAAGKLHNILSQKPSVWKVHNLLTLLVSLIILLSIIFVNNITIIPLIIFSAFCGFIFSIRVGGADMPIMISLLNSLSGVAGGIAGIAINDPLLTSVAGMVGASGLILTQIMCKSMNRSLLNILTGKVSKSVQEPSKKDFNTDDTDILNKENRKSVKEIINTVKNVIIVPGYGMALAQAQFLVKQLSDKLEDKGAEVKFAIHPVAGRMPGHMNVLLCEVDIPYEKLYEKDDINPEFQNCDLVIVVGANDVINPAANTAEGTPIYGMPVLQVSDAKHVVICNYDIKPGYAGVPNPLYSNEKTILMLGDAKETINNLINSIDL